jgi:hypothetical protein
MKFLKLFVRQSTNFAMTVAVAPTVAVAVASAGDIRVAPTPTSSLTITVLSPAAAATASGMHGRTIQDACAATIAFIHRTWTLVKCALLSDIDEEVPIHVPNHS